MFRKQQVNQHLFLGNSVGDSPSPSGENPVPIFQINLYRMAGLALDAPMKWLAVQVLAVLFCVIGISW